MAAHTGRPSSFLHQEFPMDVVLVALAVLAVAAAARVSQVRAQRRVASLKVSGGRKSLVMNLFGRS